MSATSSHGASWQILIGTVYTEVPCTGDIEFDPGSWGTEDATCHDSSAEEELIKTVREGKTLSAPINWDTTDSVHTAVQTAYDATTTLSMQIVYPDAGTKTFRFTGLVTGLDFPAPVRGKLTRTATIAITGAITEDPA